MAAELPAVEEEGDMRLQPSPEERLRELELQIEQSEPSAAHLVELRQECLALAQIACHDDLYQLGRAACNLAAAYLAAGMAGSAVSHAERAESLLLASASRTESADLLPTALLVLADSLAARASSLSRAARGAVAKKENRVEPVATRTNPRVPLAPHTRPHRNHEVRTDGEGVDTLTMNSARKRRTDAASMYKRAADTYHRALLASHEVFGKGHVECCPVLRGWARMSVERSNDFELARRLLLRELEIRNAGAGRTPSTSEAETIRQLKRELAGNMLLEAKAIIAAHSSSSPVSASAAGSEAAERRCGSMDGGSIVSTAPRPKGTDVASVRAANLRQEAVALLDESGGGGWTVGATTHAGAQLALKLAEACCELKAWGQAEPALLSAIGYTEETYGCCDKRSVALWAELASIRLKHMGRYEEAATDLLHVVNMLTLLHGPHDERLISPCEELCHAHLMLGRWAMAKKALTQAHSLACARYGIDSQTAKRLAQVLRSIDEQMPKDARDEGLLDDAETDEDLAPHAAIGA